MTSSPVPDTPNPEGRKKRALPRFNFIASTVLTEPVSAIRLSGRVTEISRGGCYVDILNALPLGTLLNLEITCDLGRFSTQGKIVYVHPGIGMGVAFVAPPENQLKVLDAWLAAFPATAAI
jgi:hypothetical protein